MAHEMAHYIVPDTKNRSDFQADHIYLIITLSLSLIMVKKPYNKSDKKSCKKSYKQYRFYKGFETFFYFF